MMVRRGLAGVALVLCASSAACATIIGLEPLDFDASDGGPDGAGGAGDGSSDAPEVDGAHPDAPLPDAGLDAFADAPADAGPVSCYDRFDGSFDGAKIVFCDDFEREAGVDDGWAAADTQNGGTVELSTEMSSSGSRSALVTIPFGASDGDKVAVLQTSTLPPKTPVVLEADFFLAVGPPFGPTYPQNGFTIVRHTNVGGGFKEAYVRDESANVFDPFFFVTDPSQTLAQGTWCHLTWRVAGLGTGMHMLSVYEKSAPGTVVARSADVPLNPQHFRIGATTLRNEGPVKLFIDDVVIHE
jgi:hypothetical protein